MRNRPFQIHVTETTHKEYLLKLLHKQANHNVHYMHDYFLLTRDLQFLSSRPWPVRDPTALREDVNVETSKTEEHLAKLKEASKQIDTSLSNLAPFVKTEK